MKPAPPRASRRRYPAASGVVGPSYITTCHSPAFLRATMRRSSKFGTAGPSPQPPHAALPSSVPGRFQRCKLAYKCAFRVSDVPGTGQGNRTGALSGADFGFWRPSAREQRRRLGRFRDRRRFMGAEITQRTIRVVCIHPHASPAIAQICRFYACRSMSRSSRKRT